MVWIHFADVIQYLSNLFLLFERYQLHISLLHLHCLELHPHLKSSFHDTLCSGLSLPAPALVTYTVLCPCACFGLQTLAGEERLEKSSVLGMDFPKHSLPARGWGLSEPKPCTKHSSFPYSSRPLILPVTASPSNHLLLHCSVHIICTTHIILS